MSLISVVIVLVIVGVILYVINQAIPMDSRVRIILNAVVVIALLLWLLNAFGYHTGVRVA